MYIYVLPLYYYDFYNDLNADSTKVITYIDVAKDILKEYITIENKFEFVKVKMEKRLHHFLNSKFFSYVKIKLSVQSYWRGQLKTIEEIYIEMTQNVFDLPSYPKYLLVFSKSMFSILFYVIIDVMNFLLEKNDYPTMVIESINQLYNSNFPLINFSKY